MNGRPKLKYVIEYAALCTIGAFVCVVPAGAGRVAAWAFARVAFVIMRERRIEAERRIKTVFGESMTDKEVRKIAWISLRNTAFNIVEMMSIRRTDEACIRKMFTDFDKHIGRIRSASEKHGGAGVILALPHMGNWDLAGTAVFLGGLPIFSVAGKQRNPLVNSLINKLRSGHGMDIIERGSRTLAQIVFRLKKGQIFAILPDTRSPTPDVQTAFLGGTANIARGMASFSRSTGAPILPTVIRRIGWSRFELKMFDEILPDNSVPKKDDVERMTRETIAILDREIRISPEQWFWYNKRWVLDPVEESAHRNLGKE